MKEWEDWIYLLLIAFTTLIGGAIEMVMAVGAAVEGDATTSAIGCLLSYIFLVAGGAMLEHIRTMPKTT